MTALLLFLLLYLFLLERIEILAGVLYTPLSIFCFILLEWMLLQGTAYWFFKWRRMSTKAGTRLTPFHYQWFGFLKKSNLLLLLIAAGWWIAAWNLNHSANGWALFLLVFAAGEHINYYHIRLSYQTPAEWNDWKRRGWQRSVLDREMSHHRRVKQDK